MMIGRPHRCLVALAVFAALEPSAAQTPTPPASPAATVTAAPLRQARATRLTGSLHIDGKLDEAAWATAAPSGDFMQSYPNVGAKPTDPTEVRILYDDDAIYVGVRMFDSHPEL